MTSSTRMRSAVESGFNIAKLDSLLLSHRAVLVARAVAQLDTVPFRNGLTELAGMLVDPSAPLRDTVRNSRVVPEFRHRESSRRHEFVQHREDLIRQRQRRRVVWTQCGVGVIVPSHRTVPMYVTCRVSWPSNRP